ncbi:MAG: geranylgeranylglycerol-phosphate geranylgeranyltransferase [Candidatus Eisenbacteria bacterium]|nr:geranylgeranylglycerol-phosphate geranylgeranyltransferase [Candidatus Eisenbacteria bacterium]
MRAAWIIVRPGNLALLAAALLFAWFLAGGGGEARVVVFGIAGAVLLAAGFYVWNDMDDREIDRVNRPERPLASGALSMRAAGGLRILLLACATAAGAVAGPIPLAVFLLWSVFLVAYERVGKGRGLPGNLIVAALGGSALLFGAWLGGDPRAGLYPALFAFFLHLGREIVKDVADREGDGSGRRATLPLRLGDRRAIGVSAAPLAGLVILTPIPFLLGDYNWVYLFVFAVGVDLLLAWGMIRCWIRPDRGNLVRLSRILKGQMIVAMLAILLGSPS